MKQKEQGKGEIKAKHSIFGKRIKQAHQRRFSQRRDLHRVEHSRLNLLAKTTQDLLLHDEEN